MASSSPFNSKSHLFHARSNSLPCRTHPLVSQIDEHLCKLTASEATSSSSISNSINGLTDLYDLVNNFLLLPYTQQVLAQECNGRQVDEVLDGYLRLMDVCSTTKNGLLKIKEDTQEFQSIMRRRRGDESRLKNEVGEYLSSSKKEKKVICKSFRNLKSKCKLLDQETVATVSLLRDVEGVTIRVFESLLSYISGTKALSTPFGWSLVSKLMHSKSRAFKENATESNLFGEVDTELYTLIGHKTRNSSCNNAENALNMLRKLESTIQELEEALESLLRRLIKTRVSLLNIINH